MAAASVSAASESQFSVRGGICVGSRWVWTALWVASLFRRLDLASALVPQDGGLPEVSCHSGRLQLCLLEQQPPPFPLCARTSSQPVLWSVVPSQAGARSGLLKQSPVSHVSVTAQLGNPQ